MLAIYKLVVRDPNGKIKQIHERYAGDIMELIYAETKAGYIVTVTRLTK